jgi:oligoribonuclease NrnB/cAMP/cGMP phosphodiesterase (DHH superfamily)
MDGKCSAAIVKTFMDGLSCSDGLPQTYHPINYNMPFPFDDIMPDEQIFIVDFSLQKKGDFEKLLEITKDVTWIDHHKTAIEKHGNIGLKGLRKDGVAACQLTWDYIYRGSPTPMLVKYLADYDVWKFKYGNDTNKIQAGIRLYNTSPEDDNWNDWLFSDSDKGLSEIKEKGETALQYRDNYYAGLIKAFSFFTTFHGYRCVACNAGSVSSQLFDTVEGEYDIMMPFVFDGTQWTVSLYTEDKSIDVSEIAKKYGGGGHNGAAGFQCKNLPFLNDIQNKDVDNKNNA